MDCDCQTFPDMFSKNSASGLGSYFLPIFVNVYKLTVFFMYAWSIQQNETIPSDVASATRKGTHIKRTPHGVSPDKRGNSSAQITAQPWVKIHFEKLVYLVKIKKGKIQISSGVTRGLSQGGQHNRKEPNGHSWGPTDQHSEKSWEMMVNPDAGSYTKTWDHRKSLRKTQIKQQPSGHQKNTKYQNISGGPVFTFSLPGGGSHTCPLSVTPLPVSTTRSV